MDFRLILKVNVKNVPINLHISSPTYNQCILCDIKEDPKCNVDGCLTCKSDDPEVCAVCKEPLTLILGKCIMISSEYSSDLDLDTSYSEMTQETSSDSTTGSSLSPPTRSHSPTISPLPPPTKPPVKTENVDLSEFEVNDDKATINMDKDSFQNDVVYNIEIPEKIKEITIDSDTSKSVSLVLSEGMKEISINSNGKANKQVDIVTRSSEITITLDEQTNASLTNAKGIVTLENNDNKQLNLNQISPQMPNFTLIPKVPIKIQEVEFLGEQGMNIQASSSNSVEVERVKIQAHSSGTINNATIKNILLAPLSSLRIVGNVDMSDSKIDLSYNNAAIGSTTQAPLSGELNSVPESIQFNLRDFEYLENNERFLIAESESPNFKCNDWVKVFKKGPFNSKLNDAECKEENNIDNKKVNRMFAFIKEDEKDDDKGLNGGAIAGIVIAVVIVVGALIGVLVYFLVIKKRKDANESSENEAEEV